ncbi:MAG TPA: DUF4397 domain-containing protein, partial [Aggregatilineales bacterium]|nr:DUF4397 domain-containing protein [Aggregatilineales bacterium]
MLMVTVTVRRWAFLLVVLVLLAACGGEEPLIPTFTPDVTNTPLPSPPPSATPPPTLPSVPTIAVERVEATPFAAPATVRLVQANAALESVDVYLANRVIGARMRPGQFSNTAIEVPAGSSTFRIVASGTINAPSNALYEDAIQLQPEQDVVIYIYGSAEDVGIAVYNQDLSPLEAGTARIAVVHAVPGGSEIRTLANGEQFGEAIGYGEVQTPSILPVGSYRISFQSGAALYTTDIALENQRVYTLMLIGEALQGRYDSILFSEAAVPQSLVRVVNASPDAPALRVFLDDTPLLESISAGETTSDFLPVIARRYTLSITTADAATPDDAANPPLYQAEVNFPINARAELVIVGRLDSMQAGLYPLNTDPVGESQARLTIIHAIPGQGILRTQISSIVRQTQTVDLVETTDAPLRLEIAFGT